MTRLEAVNEILAAAGIRPVAALDTDGTSFAAEAERVLDREELRIQSTGWGYNLRADVDIAPDGNGYIVLPDETIWADTNGTDDTVDVALIGNRFYNLDENTDVFDETITCRYCLRYDFDCIPYPVREFIMATAKYKFARAVMREMRLDAGTVSDLRAEMSEAMAGARQFDNDTSNANMLDTLPFTRVRGDTGPEVR